MNDKISIDVSVLNSVLAYLGSRPYQEVFQLIAMIQDAAKLKEDSNGQS
jgi:hypothetical protein